ncbi:MAG: ATP-binding protein [Magnetococcales bacterium]|nr:ATP-binding protein [Magnetococcales bacterium]MBF0150626.1 ATP-binding protein [Magnetococcales bacterium]
MSLLDQEQLLLSLEVPPDLSFDRFIVGSDNERVFNAVKRLCDESHPSESLLLVGESGTGKTHLLHAAVRQTQLTTKSGIYVHANDLIKECLCCTDREERLNLSAQYQNYHLVALDAFELLATDATAQEVVLYLYNLLLANGGIFLIASQVNPMAMVGLRSELRSRLLWGKVLELHPLGDEELFGVMQKIAFDRSLQLSDDLIHFLVMRLPRSVLEYTKAIELLDQQSSRRSRNIAIPLAKELFNL